MFVDGSSCVSKDEVVCLSCDFVDLKNESLKALQKSIKDTFSIINGCFSGTCPKYVHWVEAEESGIFIEMFPGFIEVDEDCYKVRLKYQFKIDDVETVEDMIFDEL